ncbi:MAG: thymidine phosphorylase [Bacteroidetes bacterium]|nr:thymidine phosphorylase [Bacteroidota bacterium]MBU1679400.1 thymidine phosphorylase [Bacteroidota bacterium]MBU2505569.1 thymidine phosphorylase [Bacteroidota bacterium]
MNTVELIRKKRDKKKYSEEELGFLIKNYTAGKIPDYQISSFLMAAYLNGMDKDETAYLTKAMLYSGIVIDLSNIKGPKVDKHSTGGVGDKTSLIIAPIVAAAGVNVPMISGRGLGHSGGTLDKLESIPGFRTNLSLSEYKRVIKKCGAVLIGQTSNIAPADKLIYALRDVTATIESIPLITGSIMSKKLAEGIDGLVLDIKCGSGAFMKDFKSAKSLASSLIDTAKAFDKKVIGIITDMNQPLGNYIGNWLEVFESIEALQGAEIDDLMTVSLNLSGAMIYMGGKASSIKEGIEISKDIIASGKAMDKFIEIVKNQNGDVSFIMNPGKYPKSKYSEVVSVSKNGYLKFVDNYEIGMSALELGAGRMVKEDVIDPKAGIVFIKKIGDYVKRGEPVAVMYTDRKAKVDPIKNRITSALVLDKYPQPKMRLIKKIIE